MIIIIIIMLIRQKLRNAGHHFMSGKWKDEIIYINVIVLVEMIRMFWILFIRIFLPFQRYPLPFAADRKLWWSSHPDRQPAGQTNCCAYLRQQLPQRPGIYTGIVNIEGIMIKSACNHSWSRLLTRIASFVWRVFTLCVSSGLPKAPILCVFMH